MKARYTQHWPQQGTLGIRRGVIIPLLQSVQKVRCGTCCHRERSQDGSVALQAILTL